MPTTAKIIAIGNSAGIILPKETLARLNVEKGDTVCLSETPFGAHLTPYDDQFMRKTGSIGAGDEEVPRCPAETG